MDIAQIEAQNITDNVVELLVLKLKKAARKHSAAASISCLHWG
jgi:hypothetical protein